MANNDSDEDRSFAELMAGVKKISDDRVNIYRDRTKDTAISRRDKPSPDSILDFASINYGQLSEISDSRFDSGIQKKLERKIRQGQLPLEDRIDLHGYNQKEALATLANFLHQAVSANFRLIMIIHGKGNSSGSEPVLKPLVQHWLAQQSSVLGWCPAQAKHGGSGASYVYLRVQR
jgi:DNA-nicking Smr family endonuclease